MFTYQSSSSNFFRYTRGIFIYTFALSLSMCKLETTCTLYVQTQDTFPFSHGVICLTLLRLLQKYPIRAPSLVSPNPWVGAVPKRYDIISVRLRVIVFNVPTLGIVALTSMTLYVQRYTKNKRSNDPSTPSPLLAVCALVGRMHERE